MLDILLHWYKMNEERTTRKKTGRSITLRESRRRCSSVLVYFPIVCLMLSSSLLIFKKKKKRVCLTSHYDTSHQSTCTVITSNCSFISSGVTLQFSFSAISTVYDLRLRYNIRGYGINLRILWRLCISDGKRNTKWYLNRFNCWYSSDTSPVTSINVHSYRLRYTSKLVLDTYMHKYKWYKRLVVALAIETK